MQVRIRIPVRLWMDMVRESICMHRTWSAEMMEDIICTIAFRRLRGKADFMDRYQWRYVIHRSVVMSTMEMYDIRMED